MKLIYEDKVQIYELRKLLKRQLRASKPSMLKQRWLMKKIIRVLPRNSPIRKLELVSSFFVEN